MAAREQDRELMAAARCVRALGELTPQERARVVLWLACRFIEHVQASAEDGARQELAQSGPNGGADG